MLGIIRAIILIFLLLTVIYVLLSQISRWRERSRLSDEYRAHADRLTSVGSEDEFIAQGMTAYNRSLRPKLFLFVYAIPGVIGTLLVWLAMND